MLIWQIFTFISLLIEFETIIPFSGGSEGGPGQQGIVMVSYEWNTKQF